MGRRSGRDDADAPSGIAVIDKDAGWTSHDVVARSRGLLGTRKVGHAGTLDPDATGVLVLGVGRATRLLRYCQLLGKSYEAEIRFGEATSTLDAAGEVTARADMSITPSEVAAATGGFLGDILQVPPMVSAIKIDGQRLHQLARAGIEVERPPRPVRVTRFDTTPTEDPLVYRALVECSSGTYVRSLAADLGEALGGHAHLRSLRRTAVGGFTLDTAVGLDELDPTRLRPVGDAVAHLDRLDITEDRVAQVAVGGVLDAEALGVLGAGPWATFGPDGTLLAVYERFRAGSIKPSLVLT